MVALVGPSGGGKSTILKLLLGFYPVETGQVLIGGAPIGTLSLDTLRAQSAYVPQDPLLFDATIRENLRYGRPDASDADIEAAARAAYAHDFIQAIPDGVHFNYESFGLTLRVSNRKSHQQHPS